MKRALPLLVATVFGLLFIFVPTGSKMVEVKFECGYSQMCPMVYSSSQNITLRGFPLKSNIIVEDYGFYKSEHINTVNAAIDFIAGFAIGRGATVLILSHRSRSSTSKKLK